MLKDCLKRLLGEVDRLPIDLYLFESSTLVLSACRISGPLILIRANAVGTQGNIGGFGWGWG